MEFNRFIDFIRGTFPELVTDEAVEKFRIIGEAYKDWNSKINVISRKDIDEIYSHHILHSLAVAEFLKASVPEVYALMGGGAGSGGAASGTADGSAAGSAACDAAGDGAAGGRAAGGRAGLSFLDLGTGGGFPGIPLAILFPACSFTLCDSIGKKIRVATEVAAAASLTNIKTLNARAESLDEEFDFIVSRAVAPLDMLMSWIKGKYSRGLICLKGGDVLPEISEAIRKFRICPKAVTIRPVTDWIHEEYFEGKSVIFVRK